MRGWKATVFISAIPPFLKKTPDNPEGVDTSVFEGLQQGIVADRPAFLARFFSDFYNADQLGGSRVSDQILQLSWSVAAHASPTGTLESVSAWLTDFRDDLRRIDVPTLVIHGDADRIVPFEASGKRTPDLVRGSRLVVVEGGPHAISWTHPEIVNRELLEFLAETAPTAQAVAEART